jgi:hypothetical protein
VARDLRDYDVEVSAPKGQPLTVRVKDGGREVLAFRGHWETAFTRLGDTLFVAEFSPIASGCAVVAFDLTTGRQVWRCRLRGLGPVAHSRYRNRVTIETDGRVVLVRGWEALGRYIEVVDPKTGKSAGHKKYAKD